MSNTNIVPKLYRNVIEEVIKNVKEAFLNEGVDEQVLQELKQIWENKLLQSRAVDGMPADNQPAARQQYMYPHIVQSNPGIPAGNLVRPQQPQQPQQQQRVAISHASSTAIPGSITHRQATTGQTTIIFPEARTGQAQTHLHALSQMTPAATAATLALPGMQQRPTGVPTTYPTARTIQVTQTHQQQLQQQLQQQQGQQQQQVTVQRQQPQQVTVQRQQPQQVTVQRQQPQQVTLQRQQPQQVIVQHQQPQQVTAQRQQPQQVIAQRQQPQQVTAQVQANKPPQMIIQVDGVNDSDSDDGDDDDLGDDDEDNERNAGQEFEDEQEPPEEDDPLNSGDDDSDDGATDLFDTENVVVCQFEKIARSRNRWKFHLKDGIMNVKGKDYIFHKATGEAEW